MLAVVDQHRHLSYRVEREERGLPEGVTIEVDGDTLVVDAELGKSEGGQPTPTAPLAALVASANCLL